MSTLFLQAELLEEQALQAPPVSGLWAGVVSKGAAEAGDKIEVTIPDVDPDVVFTPIWWLPQGESLPARGDPCLVALDNNSTPWVIAWVPS